MTSKQRVKYFKTQNKIGWENEVELFVNNEMIEALSIAMDERGVLLLYKDLSA